MIGTGHVGAITCLSLASVGHRVVGCDADSEKVNALANGRVPFHEPGAQDLLKEQLAGDRLTFTPEIAAAVSHAEVVFIWVGTPPRVSGEANLLAVERAGRDIAGAATGPLVIVEKSTVPAGTAGRFQKTLGERSDLAGSLEVVSNPEFLREGQALNDALHPDRILVGASSPRAFAVMRRLYGPFLDVGVQLIETDIASAELAKHACNAFLALKISYANALARLCESSGADIEAVTRVMGADPRIGTDFRAPGSGSEDIASRRTSLRSSTWLIDSAIRSRCSAKSRASTMKPSRPRWPRSGRSSGIWRGSVSRFSASRSSRRPAMSGSLLL